MKNEFLSECLKHIDSEGYIHCRFSRTSDVDNTYAAHRSKVLSKYKDMGEYIKSTILNQKEVDSPDGVVCIPCDSSKDMAIVRNDFPYKECVKYDIDHYIIWTTKPLSYERCSYHAKKVSEGKEFIWFINPPQYKSIPELWHMHVLVASNPTPRM